MLWIYKAYCINCLWHRRYFSQDKASKALTRHLDSHPDSDLPVGGGVR